MTNLKDITDGYEAQARCYTIGSATGKRATILSKSRRKQKIRICQCIQERSNGEKKW
ncbi:hypothetical protein Rleg_6295 (plasmid) [Rhizobium leguminosarum bv. trifolii WSM1325]|uniref:Uncharacterized protein n=1 Tax=Rhizobium leguminosarum bv. trifolii (strain WSM1325) TaxID=395491 RepID=C6BAD8_RHILS|nr:hypothetical protein Rleg_6295 [Rhizobium leguminosarum bv. trifolii WSM1325]